MLRQMREWFRWLKWLLVIIIGMFLWWAVATWGGGVAGLRRQAEWAGKVNGELIGALTFQSAARRLDGTYQSLLGDQYTQQRAFLHVGQQAINQLIDEELLYQESQRLGIGVSPAEVAQMIRRDPNFLENGQFIGLDRYRSLFQGSRISLEEYEAQVRRQLVIQKYRSLIEDGVTVSDAEVEREFLRRNRKATVDYVVIDPAKLAGRSKPSEAEVAAYYDSHRDRYAQGEGRTGIYVLFNPNDLLASQNVRDDEVKGAYERDRATRYSVNEQRRASHILFKVDSGAPKEKAAAVEAKARGVLRQLKAGADFAELARKHSEDGSAANGGDLNFFGRGQMVKEFEAAAFSLPVGGTSDLVRTNYGFHIIKVTDSRAARVIPFDEAKESILRELKMARARAEIARRSAAFSKAASGGNLETVAKSQGLTVGQTGPVREGDALPSLAASQAVVARMLALQPGQVGDPIAIPAGQVVVQVTGTAPAEPKPLSAVRDRAEKDLADERSRDTVAESLRAIQSKGGGLSALSQSLKVELKTQPGLVQGSAPAGVPSDPEIIRQIASLQPGAVGTPVVTASGIVVLSVRERQDHRDEMETQRDATRDNLVRQRQDRLYRALVRSLRDRSKVEINQPLVGALDQG